MPPVGFDSSPSNSPRRDELSDKNDRRGSDVDAPEAQPVEAQVVKAQKSELRTETATVGVDALRGSLRGVVFDLDGTLLDTMNQWNSLGIDYLRAQGVEPKSDLLDKLGTMNLRESAMFFRDEYGLDLSLFQVIDAMKSRLRRLYEENARAKEGALETLQFLKKQGVKMALATATSAELATAGLKLVGAFEYFDAILSCRDPEIAAGKDEPTVFEAARKRLGTSLEETIVVEDALYAVRTAKRAGFWVVAIEDAGERSRKAAIQEIADVYVENHSVLRRFLTTLF